MINSPMMVVRTVNSKGGHSMMNLVVRRTMLVWLKRKREVGPPSSLPCRGAMLGRRIAAVQRQPAGGPRGAAWSRPTTFVFFLPHKLIMGPRGPVAPLLGFYSILVAIQHLRPTLEWSPFQVLTLTQLVAINFCVPIREPTFPTWYSCRCTRIY